MKKRFSSFKKNRLNQTKCGNIKTKQICFIQKKNCFKRRVSRIPLARALVIVFFERRQFTFLAVLIEKLPHELKPKSYS